MRAVCSLVVALAACDRPQPLVMCHNANCASPDVELDDTFEGLTESFALEYEGRPAIDGMEWDTFWYGAESRCIFAHDLNHSTEWSADQAAEAIAIHLATHQDVAYNGERFYMFVELKGFVGESFSDAHTEDQRTAHATCAVNVLDTVVNGARQGGHRLTVGFVAGVPELLEALTNEPRWGYFQEMPDLELMLIGDIFGPYNSIVPELADYKLPLDAVEYHPDYMTAQHREAYRSLGMDLVQWQYVTTVEALGAIQRWEPAYVVTNEAQLLRRWIER
jgi:hypothetical protein